MHVPNGQIQTLTHYYKPPNSTKNKPRMPIKDFGTAILKLKWTTRHLTDSMMLMMMMIKVAALAVIIIMMTSYKICSYLC